MLEMTPIETTTLTPLGHKILEHWSRHRPRMVEQVRKSESQLKNFPLIQTAERRNE